MTVTRTVRDATLADAAACAAVYAPYVRDTAITFETEPPGVANWHGYRTAAAGITLPNDAGVGLHRALGFAPVGTFRRVGWKLGRWHDVAWTQCDLGRVGDPT